MFLHSMSRRLVAGASPGTKNGGSGFLVTVLQRGIDK